MTEAAMSGILLTLVSAGALIAGLATGTMPINYKLDTARDTAPAIFWALASWWAILAILGIGIVFRHWAA